MRQVKSFALYTLGCIVIGFLSCYFLASFVTWEFDAGLWPPEGRFFYIVVSFLLSLLVFVAAVSVLEDTE